MKKIAYLYFIVAVALVGCQSAPKATPETPKPDTQPVPSNPTAPDALVSEVPYPSSIVVGNTGFSPNAQAPANTLSFSLHFGKPDKVVSWTVEFAAADGTVVQAIQGEAPNLPPTLSWDGNSESGGLAPEGTYTARLSVNTVDSKGPVTVESAPFVLDVTPPSGSIVVSPQPFEPGDPNTMLDPPQVVFQVNLVAGGAAITSWRLGVIHPDGRRFFDFISEDHKDNLVKWNGRALNNASLEAGTTYDLVAQVFDRYGNVGWVRSTLAVAEKVEPATAASSTEEAIPDEEAPVTVSFDGKLIAETKIFFPPYSADLTKVLPWKAVKNAEAFDLLAKALASVAGTKIKVIGHANQVFWQDQDKGSREQNEVLLPLSRDRAETVRQALVNLGLNPALFEVSGVGALGPVVPFGDLVNNWKNRRVEFVIEP